MPRRLSKAAFLILLAVPTAVEAKKDKIAPDAFAVTMPDPAPPAPPANGSIFQGSYVALTSGGRAGQVGDILTIQLVERTIAAKSNSAGTTRDGSIGLTPPTTGPLSLFNPSDVAAGGNQNFKGKGDAAQSNTLSGEVSVTVAAVYPNGTMLVKGEKLLTLNRGDERVQISGIVRAIDISPDNRILSTRVANAHIRYVGKGEIARASQQGWLQRFFSIISPF
ncbi:MAG: flagellar basal body L-ring protein FlgH [Sphingopyxis sp.]|uniref:flagellar basal body L-ring protein FlgH n=1 Tax=Sphingopyxis sp. TaxID=1908224 RepID=UPI003D6D9564